MCEHSLLLKKKKETPVLNQTLYKKTADDAAQMIAEDETNLQVKLLHKLPVHTLLPIAANYE